MIAACRRGGPDQRRHEHERGEDGHVLKGFGVTLGKRRGLSGDAARGDIPPALRAHRTVRSDEAALGADPHGGIIAYFVERLVRKV